jgi:hypothetical protein
VPIGYWTLAWRSARLTMKRIRESETKVTEFRAVNTESWKDLPHIGHVSVQACDLYTHTDMPHSPTSAALRTTRRPI